MTQSVVPTLVVLAAGMSTRYGRLKQVEPLGPAGEAIVDYNLFDAMRAGFGRAVFVIRPEIEEPVRVHLDAQVGDAFPVEYVYQSHAHLPEGFRTPPDRVKPWGTGQAVLCATEVISGPFGVCNADDLYGRDAFLRLHGFLSADPPPTEAALVGYTLEDTLSGAGGVSRGLCVLGRDQLLERVTEVRGVKRVEGWIAGTTTEGDIVELRGRETVSMNLWGFSEPVVAHLRRQFRRFLDRWGASVDQEFLLSTAINGQIETGETHVTVLQSTAEWFGVTHPADRPEAQRTLAERVSAGVYPEDLADAFRVRG